MPTKPLSPCGVPGCPAPAEVRGRCKQHAEQARRDWQQRPSRQSRGYTYDYLKTRRTFLAAHPYCVDCGAPATEAHHIVKLRHGGTNDWANLLPLCGPCHKRRHASERG
jgi:5-methylcytosine-specific restriction protein A